MKRTAAILLIITTILSFAACGEKPVPTPGTDPTAPSDTTAAITTKVPADTTADTKVTDMTTASKDTTAAPAVTTAAPAITTAAPAITTAAPAITTAAPAITTAAPAQNLTPGLVSLDWESTPYYISPGNGGAYPRFAATSDGALFCVYRSGAYINCRKSTNGGASWAGIVQVTPSIYADNSKTKSEGFDVTNPEIIALPDDTLLCSFRVNKDCDSLGYYASIRVYESTDKGSTWHFHSTVVENTATNGGLWEPFFKLIDHDKNPETPDRLAIYYCNDMLDRIAKPYDFVPDESLISKNDTIEKVYPDFPVVSSSSYQDVVVQLWNEDTKKWDAPAVASNGESHNSRDGMMVVTELSDGSYAMTIESSLYRKGASKAPDGLYHRLVVRILFSDNGLEWTNPVNIYMPKGYGPDGTTPSYAGAPYIVTLPDGRIAVSFHSNDSYNSEYTVRTDGQSGQRYNCTMHVIVSEKPVTAKNRVTINAGTFTDVFEPIPIDTNGYSIWCSLCVYNGKYLIAAAGTGINTSASVASSRKLTIRRALLTEVK